MKKWIGIFLVVIGGLVYAIVRLSVSEYRAMSEGPSRSTQAPEAQRTRQVDENDAEKAEPEEERGIPATAAQVEAVTRVFSEFQSAVESGDYERAWKLLSGPFQQKTSNGSLEDFQRAVTDGEGAVLKAVTIHSESATNVAGRVRVLATVPSEEQGVYLFFVQDEGQWKWSDVRPAEGVEVPDVDRADPAPSAEESGTPATAAETEAVSKAFSQFQSTVKSEDYERAWELTSESFRSKLSFEDFKKGMAAARTELLEATIGLEPVTYIGGRMRLPVTNPSDGDDHVFFVQEDGQWKVDP
jgi:hypothetical protein